MAVVMLKPLNGQGMLVETTYAYSPLTFCGASAIVDCLCLIFFRFVFRCCAWRFCGRVFSGQVIFCFLLFFVFLCFCVFGFLGFWVFFLFVCVATVRARCDVRAQCDVRVRCDGSCAIRRFVCDATVRVRCGGSCAMRRLRCDGSCAVRRFVRVTMVCARCDGSRGTTVCAGLAVPVCFRGTAVFATLVVPICFLRYRPVFLAVPVSFYRYGVFYGAVCLSMLCMFSSFLERRPCSRAMSLPSVAA